jgi:cytochrome P450/NADPH-cytochrome P450 reductase
VKLPAASIKELQAVTPEGLFTADPGQNSWQVAHRILVPAFGPLAIREMFQGMLSSSPHVATQQKSNLVAIEMHDITSQLILKWARFGENNPINVTSEFTRLTLDTIAL